MAGTVQLDDRGVIVECAACGKKNRLAYERLGDAVQCGQCKQPLSAPGEPIEVHSTADFDRLIAQSSLPVVVDYWAPWCGPCRMVAPELQKVAARQAGQAIVVKVNTDELVGPRPAVRDPLDPDARRLRRRQGDRARERRAPGAGDRGVHRASASRSPSAVRIAPRYGCEIALSESRSGRALNRPPIKTLRGFPIARSGGSTSAACGMGAWG